MSYKFKIYFCLNKYRYLQNILYLYFTISFNNSSKIMFRSKDTGKKEQIVTNSKSQQNGATIKVLKAEDNIEKLTTDHYIKAIQFYNGFQQQFIKGVEFQLKDIQNILNAELQRTVKKLQNKLRGSYSKSLDETLSSFYLQNFVANQVQDVYKAIGKLKDKIYIYINDFCNNILSRNIKKNHELSLYYFSNEIKSIDKNWNSVSSRSPLNIAQISVKGFHRPQTTWLALGVTKKMKEFGPITGSFNKQDFMGNIYLNGSDQMTGGYKLKKDLNNNDVFIVECENRMVWIYRKNEGKNKKEVFIMDDNVQYYIYIGIKGPIELKFEAQ